jgi:hypothetical protein
MLRVKLRLFIARSPVLVHGDWIESLVVLLDWDTVYGRIYWLDVDIKRY